MQRTKKMTITFCYEVNCGGETVATEAIIQEFKKWSNASVYHQSRLPLSQSDSFHFFSWIGMSILHWMRFLRLQKESNWIYTTTFTAGVAAVLLKPFYTYKIVWHYNGSRLPPAPTGLSGKTYFTQILKRKIAFYLHTFFLGFTDLIVVPTQPSKLLLIYEFPILTTKKVVTIPNGVNLKTFKPLSQNRRLRLRAQLDLASTQKVLMYIGRLETQKRVLELLHVFAKLHKIDSTIKLVIVYVKPRDQAELIYLRDLRTLADELNLAQQIFWLREPDDLNSIYNIADLVISLSRIENLPLTLLEAWASGTMYACYPAGGTQELLAKVDTRFILSSVDPNDLAQKLRDLLDLKKVTRNIFIGKSRYLIKNYAWGTISKRVFKEFTYLT